MNRIEAAPPGDTQPGKSARRAREAAQQPQLPGFETPQAPHSAHGEPAKQPPAGAWPDGQARPMAAATGFLGRLNAIARQIGLFDAGNVTSPEATTGQAPARAPSAATGQAAQRAAPAFNPAPLRRPTSRSRCATAT